MIECFTLLNSNNDIALLSCSVRSIFEGILPQGLSWLYPMLLCPLLLIINTSLVGDQSGFRDLLLVDIGEFAPSHFGPPTCCRTCVDTKLEPRIDRI